MKDITKKERRTAYTIRDIAKMAKVSRSTVSLALNDSPRMNDGTKKKILKLIERVGYRPNQAARNLVSKESGTILAILPEIGHVFSDYYFSESVSGIFEVATGRGYHLMMEMATEAFRAENRALKLFNQHTVDGVLCVGARTDDHYITELAAAGCPVVLVNSALPDVCQVVGANEPAAFRAVRHLHSLGHTRIAHIAAPTYYTMMADRRAGYLHAVQKLKLDASEDLVAEGHFGQRSGGEAMRKLLKRSQRPTAVYAANDLMAIGAMNVILEAGLRIPEDIAIVGSGGIQLGMYVKPNLTTIQQSMYAIGQSACELLFDKLENRKIYKPRLEIGMRLVVRESCGAGA